MKKAPLPKDEIERKSELDSYKVLDTDPEACYDDLTLLASQICETPIALVSLIDSERQWFKSKQGLEAKETTRDISFCGHAIVECDDSLFVIEDSSKDSRFSDNPLVTGDPKVQFYAGYPLRVNSGHKIGTLCVIDHKPRKLTDGQLSSLKALGRQVVAQLELRKNNFKLRSAINQIEEQQQQIIETSKLASLGKMSAGIAHEINNPMSIVIGRLGILKSHFDINDQMVSKSFDSIESSVERISRIIRSMLDFSSNVKNSDEDIDISQLVDDVLVLIKEKASLKGINIDIDLDKGLRVSASKTQLSQVFINLINNAFDAVEGASNKQITIKSQEINNEVEITFEDSGEGATNDVIDKAFDPFFTTKEVGKGTGLGLSICHGLIRANNGRLEIERDRNSGFKVSVYLKKI